ncbi:hypothetical protein [Halalkalibacterium ligniniphilum]|uniref:hypothetical protein n=1 Tax=Halalkalibacterium ligniniphilum TaxID=1134413 RepID=UPI0003701835|nr:hypothetical protein [Halalkalibacterium ligniniphilum]
MNFHEELMKFTTGLFVIALIALIPYAAYQEEGWIGVVAVFGMYIVLVASWLIGRLIWSLWEKR